MGFAELHLRAPAASNPEVAPHFRPAHDLTEYRDLVVRAIYGPPPCRLRTVHDEDALMRIARDLAEGEAAKRILRAKGWGIAGTSIVEVAESVPRAAP